MKGESEKIGWEKWYPFKVKYITIIECKNDEILPTL
jgi:hypothetical protein